MSYKRNIQDGRRHDKFTIIYNEIFDNVELSASERLVYMALCRFANFNSGECFPSHRTLANATGLSIATIKRTLIKLIKRGLLAKVNRFNESGAKISCMYRVMDYIPETSKSNKSVANVPSEAQLTMNHTIAHHEPYHSSPRAINNTRLNITRRTKKGLAQHDNFQQIQFNDSDFYSLFENLKKIGQSNGQKETNI